MNSCVCGGCDTCKSELYSDAIRCMISALEYRDPYTKGHSIRVGEMASFLAKKLRLSSNDVILIHIAGQLHDIGKIGVADHILRKNGKLNDSEWKEIRNHSEIGANIVRESEQLKGIADMILQHHERWDGYGYPQQLNEYEITLGARILGLCDSLDAMASKRPYRDALEWDYIESELNKNFGSQFDPQLQPYLKPLIEFWRTNYVDEAYLEKQHVA